jgi:serine/threonine protein kinase
MANRVVADAMDDDGSPYATYPSCGDGVLAGGTKVGRYVIRSLVGRGAMGEVYRAKDPELGRKVAIKVMRARPRRAPKGSADGADGRARLLREARSMARLCHPNVVAIHDIGAFEDGVFIAMDFVEGLTVSAWLQSAARPWGDVLRVFLAAGRGLCAAHDGELVHHDFKPDNVMIDGDGQVRVMDFGLAREVTKEEATPVRDVDGPVIGTPAYMAAEQFLGDRTDARTDQFGFCVALYEALYGHRPFAGTTVLELRHNVFSANVVPEPRRSPIPRAVRRALLRGLDPHPARRFSTMRELLRTLEAASAPPRRRWRLTLAVACAAAALAAASVVTVSVRMRPSGALATGHPG